MVKPINERMVFRFLGITGYLIPLVQSLPPLGVYIGLMTIPFASYLVIFLMNFSINFPRAIFEFISPFLILEKVLVIIGFLILIYSIAYLRIQKKKGFVNSGPYRLVRHPQYLGMILSTLGLTSWSYWILNNTFGIGFLSPLQTIGVWFIELFAYIILAFVEEQYLSKKYKVSFKDYTSQIPFLIPLIKTSKKIFEIVLSIAVLTILLFFLII
jgi:protein-S-isoprenylcysteine O-methyltransferase Ste14